MKLAKFGSIFAAAVLVTGLTGCPGKKEAPAENQEMAPPAESAAVPAETPPPAEGAPAAAEAPTK